jgi:hypothetical protein
MEYLMTYGWAILIIAVVLGVLFQLGVFSSSSFAVRAPPGACQVFRPNGPGTSQNINVVGVCSGQLPQYVAQFNGNGYTSVAYNPIMKPSRISFSSWVYLSSVPNPTTTNLFWGGGDGYSSGWRLVYTAPLIYAQVNVGGGSPASASVALPSQKNWHLITGVYDSANVLLYVDGNLAASTPTTGSINYAAGGSNYVMMGYLLGGGGTVGAGQEANFQIYNVSLSANDIQSLYMEGVGGVPVLIQNLVGWWPLNGDAKDYSGNGNNGAQTAMTFSQYGK